jgi:hypothetical protein
MRFVTRILPMVGLLATLGRIAATTTRAGRCRDVLLMIDALLNRTADNLDDCGGNLGRSYSSW